MKDVKETRSKEFLFLSGPRGRWKDFVGSLKIMLEFIKGFRYLHFVGPCMTVFGSARFEEDHPYYEQARLFGRQIAQKGFTVMTGGGPGIMEAANRGAKEVNGRSVGCNIVLPKEQEPNPYLDLMVSLDHFYVRKVVLLKYSYAFIVMPGGFGTMDELFETLTLVQTNKISDFPIVLFGTRYWKNLIEQLQDMAYANTISANDSSLFLVTDSIDEGMTYILARLKEKYGKVVEPSRPKSHWWLGEKAYLPETKYIIRLE
ncbi:MAG: TIGR00730 family Rossman fold protein [Saprospiraceae bacterium]|nr:TIGR00730 family Rossman fold protein [Saprospiraceae bacterium]